MKYIDKFRKFILDKEVDAIFLTSKTNRFYISRFNSSAGYIFITKNNQYCILDFRYIEAMKIKNSNFEVVLMDKENTFDKIINDICNKENINIIGFEGDHITFDFYTEINKKIDVNFKVLNFKDIRRIKENEELQTMRKVCKIADDTFEHIIKFIEVGMTEIQVENEIVNYMKSLGAEKESFGTIVASGTRGALPHGRASKKVIESGEFVTIDFGAVLDNYCSDITRTICVGEPKDEKLIEIYNIVKYANEEAIKLLKPGMTTGEVDKIARDIIKEKGYGDYFGHNLGHGLGIMVHEYPSVASSGKNILEEGMIITIEPGIYIPNLGGVRIEDDILITENGCERLTKSTKELIKI